MTHRVTRLEVRRSCLRFHGGGEAAHQDQLAVALAREGVDTVPATLLRDELAAGADLAHAWHAQDPREARAARQLLAVTPRAGSARSG